MFRSHTCGELTINDAGKEVVLCGWAAGRRDHGKLIFIDIRDRYGIIQAVFVPKKAPRAYESASRLRSEFVIQVKGKVNPRPKGTVNPKITTGEIEILAQELVILNPCANLPFEISDNPEAGEDTRLTYRYLDLRRPKMLGALELRHRLYQTIRRFLDEEGFIEVETPLLTKSTPEGARDFLVPSRLSPGTCYALPQSPQLFKQILMVSGIEKYFQIARCFRDEDLRSDRQPEFTQLDLEMSFVDEEHIFQITEKLFYKIFKELKGIELNTPFKRLSHSETMTKYATDKPDLRAENEEFSFCWITDFPLFKFNAEEKAWESEHHPFTAPKTEDIGLLDERKLSAVKSRSYDLVLNGQEIASGSIRIHNQDLQKKIFQILGLAPEQIKAKFGFLLEAFTYGAPPHGGIAFGIERLSAIILGAHSIREVIAFPKTQKGTCLMTEAPSEVTEKQLNELNLTYKEGKEE
jgi:aspartyl-tRNA synthetase